MPRLRNKPRVTPTSRSTGERESSRLFGLLFPELPPYDAPDAATLVRLTAAGTTDVPGPLFDQNLDQDDNPDGVPSFFTYFGQFLDHDMTLDSLPLPVDFVDPTTITNNRDQRLNLDSVYGSRRKLRPEALIAAELATVAEQDRCARDVLDELEGGVKGTVFEAIL
jgi:hypothetical protein